MKRWWIVFLDYYWGAYVGEGLQSYLSLRKQLGASEQILKELKGGMESAVFRKLGTYEPAGESQQDVEAFAQTWLLDVLP